MTKETATATRSPESASVSAKAIQIRPIESTAARRIIRALHYSGTVVQNSQLHFGVFLAGVCGGALSFGPPLDRTKLLHWSTARAGTRCWS